MLIGAIIQSKIFMTISLFYIFVFLLPAPQKSKSANANMVEKGIREKKRTTTSTKTQKKYWKNVYIDDVRLRCVQQNE